MKATPHFVILGVSGSGKDTLAEELVKVLPNLEQYSVSSHFKRGLEVEFNLPEGACEDRQYRETYQLWPGVTLLQHMITMYHATQDYMPYRTASAIEAFLLSTSFDRRYAITSVRTPLELKVILDMLGREGVVVLEVKGRGESLSSDCNLSSMRDLCDEHGFVVREVKNPEGTPLYDLRQQALRYLAYS